MIPARLKALTPWLLSLVALALPATALAGSGDESYLVKIAPIIILLVVVAIAIGRLPKVELGHSDDFMRRRVMNWLPLGLTYAFLYMGRYNLTVSKNEFSGMGLMTNSDFGVIFGIGTMVYGCAFLLNGPLTDRFGGKKAILAGAGGSAIMNLLMGLVTTEVVTQGVGPVTDAVTAIATPFFAVFSAIRQAVGLEVGDTEQSVLLPALSLLYAGNMYFQSFGAVAIVKVNAPWFHVRERGVFGAIFGILISLGVFFAYDLNGMILKAGFPTQSVFLAPALMLAIFWVISLVMVKDTPGEAGHDDFDTADASSGDEGPQLGPIEVFKRMLTNPVIMTIAFIEFCSGFLRQAIMQWYIIFAKQTGIMDTFVPQNWGLLLCCAGIMGGVFAGVISDRVFDSRRGPVAAVLYGGMLTGAILMVFALGTPMLGWLVIAMSLCVIGVHGMLSGTASMDFGGKKNVGIAVGIIDGFVYAGTGVMSFIYGWRLPQGELAKDPANWGEWPIIMIPVAVIGLALASRVWHAKPKPKAGEAA
ncbi:MAG: MFS transporter [Alphaproteobacteria bacterium]|nr:MFS transporter [Alphaproteobacteria bacterium]MCB9791620.1 MFS transporter [Alphaproteobacteria bacterium]